LTTYGLADKDNISSKGPIKTVLDEFYK